MRLQHSGLMGELSTGRCAEFLNAEDAKTSQKAQNEMVKTLRGSGFTSEGGDLPCFMIKKRQMTLGPHPPCGNGLARDQALVATRRLIAGKPAPTTGSETA